MATALDVAAYILEKKGEMTAMKLQKLVYYAQAWSLVWDEKPLFSEHIEAWANGPVVPALYSAHRGMFRVLPGNIPGNPNALNNVERETVDAVVGYYGDRSPQWLSELTHAEPPWREARANLLDGERGSVQITHAAMCEYYLTLASEG